MEEVPVITCVVCLCVRLCTTLLTRTTAWNDRLCGSGGQSSRSHEAEIGHRNPFWQDFLRTVRRILTKPGGTYYGKYQLCYNNLDAKGQRLSWHEAIVRFGGIMVALLSAPLCWVAFLVLFSFYRFFLFTFLSASLYFSKRGAYWDRLCSWRRWSLVVTHVNWPNGAS